MFIGPCGTGKTTNAYLFAAEYLGCSVAELHGNPLFLEINASGLRGIDIIRTKVTEFSGMKAGERRRIILFQEADGLTADAQDALRDLTEDRSASCIWLYTLNSQKKMDDALISRATRFYLNPHTYDEFLPWFEESCAACGTTYVEGIPQKIHNYYKGDCRSVISDFLTLYEGQHITKFDPLPTFVDEIWAAKDSAAKYLELAAKNYIPAEELIKNLLEKNGFKGATACLEASRGLKMGVDPSIAILSVLNALKP